MVIVLIIDLEYLDTLPVLRWNRTGVTVAGVTGQVGNASNQLNNPLGLYVDWANTLYIADDANNRIQKYLKDAIFGETVAGDSTGIGGPASNLLNHPSNLAVDLDGNMYVCDRWNHRIQLWKRGASNGTTLTGITDFNFHKILFEYL